MVTTASFAFSLFSKIMEYTIYIHVGQTYNMILVLLTSLQIPSLLYFDLDPQDTVSLFPTSSSRVGR
jgi:hypothetical protein